MDKIDFYLTHAHAARRRTMYLSVGVGALCGGIAESFGASLADSTVACVAATVVVELLGIARYVMPDRKDERAIAASPIRRSRLIQAGVMLLAILVVMAVRVPERVMAAFEQRLRDAATDPTLPRSGEKAKKALREAIAAEIKISPDVLGSTGRRFMEVSAKNSDAWGVTQHYLDYRSFLNKDLSPRPSEANRWKKSLNTSGYMDSVNIRPGGTRPGLIQRSFSVTYSEGGVLPEKSARLELLSRPQSVSSNYAFVIIDGGVDSLVLDEMYMKNVIVRNSDVIYDGGAVILDNVYFINCEFHLQQTATAMDLGNMLLVSTSVSFQTRP